MIGRITNELLGIVMATGMILVAWASWGSGDVLAEGVALYAGAWAAMMLLPMRARDVYVIARYPRLHASFIAMAAAGGALYLAAQFLPSSLLPPFLGVLVGPGVEGTILAVMMLGVVGLYLPRVAHDVRTGRMTTAASPTVEG